MKLSDWLKRDVPAPKVSTWVILSVTSVFLVLVIVLTVWFSNDPNWARWHISYLGEGNSFSAHFFNISMWVAALFIFWLSLSFRRDLDRLQAEGGARFRGVKPQIVQLGLIIMAVCVYLVGLFPRSFGVMPHDIFGHVIYFAFLALCLASPWILPGMSRWFYVSSYAFHGAMMIIFIAYWVDINDSLYTAEVANFVFFLGWLMLLLRESRRVQD